MSRFVGKWQRITLEIVNGAGALQRGEMDLTVASEIKSDGEISAILLEIVTAFDKRGIDLDRAAHQKLMWVLGQIGDFLSDVGEENVQVHYTIRATSQKEVEKEVEEEYDN